MPYRLLPLALLAAILLVACNEQQITPSPKPTPGVTSIEGTLIWPEDVPEGHEGLPTVLRLVEAGGHTEFTVTTTGLGEFTYAFEDIPAGEYALTATSTFHGAHRANITIENGRTTTVDLDLAPLATLSGKATLEGQPSNSGLILIRILNTPFQATTSFMGDIQLVDYPIPAGTYTLTFSKEGFETVTLEDLVIRAGEDNVVPTLVLPRAQ